MIVPKLGVVPLKSTKGFWPRQCFSDCALQMKRSEAQARGQRSWSDYHIGHCMTTVSTMLCFDNVLDVIFKHEEEDETHFSTVHKLDHPFRRTSSPRHPPFNVLIKNLMVEYTRPNGLITDIYFLCRFTICTLPPFYTSFIMGQPCVLSVVIDTQ